VDASPILLVLNQAGLDTAEDIAKRFSTARIHGLAGRVPTADTQFNETIEHIQMLFKAGHPIIGFCASGILIRALAPILSDKRTEPPVVAVSEDGSSIVPLLGGHRGANELARLLAKALGGHAAITTAGDTALGIALDAPPKGWKLANPEDAKPVMAELLSGAPVQVLGSADWLKRDKLTISEDAELTLLATDEPVDGTPTRLVYHPQRYVVGVGCARGCDPQELIDLVDTHLAVQGVAKGAVACVATIDLKADEAAMNALAAHLDAPYVSSQLKRWNWKSRASRTRLKWSTLKCAAMVWPKAQHLRPLAAKADWWSRNKKPQTPHAPSHARWNRLTE
jgi:cobalt-precorrin 5A hydrolase/precorrin-3B C17-methyltransferase